MPECAVCGGSEFTPHDGFYYCTVCQTQSQDLQQMELSYDFTATCTTRKRLKPRIARSKSSKSKLGEGPIWTSWQAYNFMLRGMTDELIALGVPHELEHHVLEFWAAYLHNHEVAFRSHAYEHQPKLDYPFRYRDANIIYGLDPESCYSIKSGSTRSRSSRKSSRSRSSRQTGTSSGGSSATVSVSKKTRLKQVMHMSQIESAPEDDVNQTLQTLAGTAPPATKVHKTKYIHKRYLSKEGFKKQKLPYISQDYAMNKSKLLCLLYLAMMKMNYPVQISDLFRFIHEGSLSYANMSHFLPAEVQFGHKDNLFINYRKDKDMPSHERIISLCPLVAHSVGIKRLPVPDLPQLIRRYASELLLPDEFADLAIHLLLLTKTPLFKKVNRKIKAPAFDLIAIAPLLVVFKLLLGMDGVTERKSSHFADTLNKLNPEARLFSFLSWQRAIECRSTVLATYHYPTHEKLRPDEAFAPAFAAAFLSAGMKDSYLRDRLGAPCYLHPTQIVDEVERVVASLRQASNLRKCGSGPNFVSGMAPSLVHLQQILSWVSLQEETEPPWLRILDQNWSAAKISHLTDPQQYLNLLNQHQIRVRSYPKDWLSTHMRRATWITDQLSKISADVRSRVHKATVGKKEYIASKRIGGKKRAAVKERNREGVVYCPTDRPYWLLRPPCNRKQYKHIDEDSDSSDDNIVSSKSRGRLFKSQAYSFLSDVQFQIWSEKVFETEVVAKFSSTWLWLLTQCSNMLFASKRDIYAHVLEMEYKLTSLFNDD